MGIVHVRIDDRLIHGQVATMWTNYLGVNRIMVIADKAASDDFLKTSLKLAVPHGIALSVLSTEKAADRINDGKYSGQRVFVILRSVDTLCRLLDLNVYMTEVNFGNITKTGDRIKIFPTVSLTVGEIKQLKNLQKYHIKLMYQLTPQDEAENITSVLDKIERGGLCK